MVGSQFTIRFCEQYSRLVTVDRALSSHAYVFVHACIYPPTASSTMHLHRVVA